MIITFGKYNGQSVELLMLKQPPYINWILDQPTPSGPLGQVKNEIMRLAKEFDNKPFLEACASHNCNNIVTRASLYKNNVLPMWWCNDCNPDPIYIREGRVQMVETYIGALNHVTNYCQGEKSDYRFIIPAFAQVKGLSKRVTEAEVQQFFNGIMFFR